LIMCLFGSALPEDANRAIELKNGSTFWGRRITVFFCALTVGLLLNRPLIALLLKSVVQKQPKVVVIVNLWIVSVTICLSLHSHNSLTSISYVISLGISLPDNT